MTRLYFCETKGKFNLRNPKRDKRTLLYIHIYNFRGMELPTKVGQKVKHVLNIYI